MRLLSYNIHKGIGGRDRRYRLERIIDVIEQENPDIICLQEVDRNVRRSKFHDQPAMLAEYFNVADHLYQLNVHLQSGGYGNLILSRWPFRSHHQISLRLNRKKPRGAQLVAVETPEGALHLVHWHLGLAERERHWQVEHVLNHHLFREAADLPTLIVGDCNDWRNTLHHGRFAPHGFEQVTAPPSRFRSFPAYLAVGALDKAFYRGGLTIRHARVVRTPLAKCASDHLPLVLDLHVGTPPLADVLEREESALAVGPPNPPDAAPENNNGQL
jgi:endonuclease/exonuclease/phosphatase family metal-dependent hydrolase